jgi:hypothetical protein
MQKSRDARREVKLDARLESDEGRREIQILNISSRGFMARCEDPPARGTYIEVQLGAQTIVARVMWSSWGRFGVLAQDRIDLDGSGSARAVEDAGKRPKRARLATYQPHQPSLEERQAASFRFARAFEFGVLVVAVCTGAALLAGSAYETMKAPLDRTESAFAGNTG